MRIYISHPSSIAYEAELYVPLRAALAEHDLILPHTKEWADSNTFDVIRTVDLVLAEVSAPSTGQGIELGWADAVGVPIVAIHRESVKPSSAIRLVAKKITTYTSVEDLKGRVRTIVAAMA